jgi:hypothetical protein
MSVEKKTKAKSAKNKEPAEVRLLIAINKLSDAWCDFLEALSDTVSSPAQMAASASSMIERMFHDFFTAHRRAMNDSRTTKATKNDGKKRGKKKGGAK